MDINRITQPTPALSNEAEDLVMEQLPVGWPWRLLIFSIIIFAFTIFVYIGLRFGYGSYLDTSSKTLDSDLKKLSERVPEADRAAFHAFYSQTVNLKTILDKHLYTSNVFKFLERNTIGTVYFTDADMTVIDRAIRLRGFGSSFETVAQQMAILERAKEVDRVLLDDVSVQTEGVIFSLTLTFKPEVLSKQL
ncbi:hypothetical protein HY967_00880 [Candidatus Jorgensenbacteria bacterium]|nr:hypothetical protein [Candidatus Jorgensenbacteria bacterium]